jgi:hypothetical protein
MPFDDAQSRGVIQVLSRPQEQIWVIVKDTERRVTSLAQHPPNVIRIMAVVHCKFVLFQLKGLLTNSTIIPLKFQE